MHLLKHTKSIGKPVAYLTRQFESSRFLPWLVLLVSLASTFYLWSSARNTSLHDLQVDFDYHAQETEGRVEQRMQAYESVLLGTQGLFAASLNVNREEFRTYLANLRLEERHPGIQGVGFTLIVPPAQKDHHVTSVRKEVFRNNVPLYTIWPEGVRKIYTSIVYIEPFYGRNLRAFGYDMYSEPVRRTAMDRARDTGKVSISGKVQLVQETERDLQAGFLMYLPIYKNGVRPVTIAERRANIIGWVYAVFRMHDLMRGILGERNSEFDAEIYDGAETSSNTLMYDSDHSEGIHLSSGFKTLLPLDIAGYHWTLLIRSQPSFEARLDTNKARLIALNGTALSLLLALLTWSLARGQSRAVHAAQKMNRELIKSETRARLAITSSQLALWDYDITTGSVYLSEGWSELLGGEQQPTTTTIQELTALVPEEDRPMVKAGIEKAIKGKQGSSYQVTHRVRKLDGGYLWVYSNGQVTERDQDGRAMRMLGTNRDITERKLADLKLLQSEASLRAILDNAPYLVWLKDTGHRYVSVNKAFVKATGKARMNEVLGKTDYDLWPKELAEKYHADDIEVLASQQKKLTEEMSWNDGKLYWVETFKAPILDQDGNLIGSTGFSRDITDRKQQEGAMRKMAHYDALTELPNRILFSDRIEQALLKAKRDSSYLAVILLDLDKFKPINDTFGHQVGDLMLKEVAQRLVSCLRESDTVSRLGGDEFLILLSTIQNRQHAAFVANKIQLALGQPFQLEEYALKISASLGIAIFPEHGDSEQHLVKCADIAMYHSKRTADSSVTIYTPDMHDESS